MALEDTGLTSADLCPHGKAAIVAEFMKQPEALQKLWGGSPLGYIESKKEVCDFHKKAIGFMLRDIRKVSEDPTFRPDGVPRSGMSGQERWDEAEEEEAIFNASDPYTEVRIQWYETEYVTNGNFNTESPDKTTTLVREQWTEVQYKRKDSGSGS